MADIRNNFEELCGISRSCFGFAFVLLLCFMPPCARAADGSGREDFFIAPKAEALMYSQNGVSAGGGFSMGYGSGTAMGLSLLYAIDPGKYGVVEMLFFLRIFLVGSMPSMGPFLQINAGPVLFTSGTIGTVREGIGTVSAGIGAGWRFPLGRYWFIEPAVRAGYPYIAGAGVQAGLRL